MTFDDFMHLEKNDGVIYEGRVVTVTDVKNFVKGKTYSMQGMKFKALNSMRQLEVSYYDRGLDKVVRRYPLVYLNAPRGEVHNEVVLRSMTIWDPFQDQGAIV